jgi:hypothetical protein
MRALAAGTALALLALCSCSRSAGFQPGDCVVYADDEGNVLETDRSAVKNTPMRVLAENAPGKYLVEWDTIWLDRSLWPTLTERNQEVLPARADFFRFLKVHCPDSRK